MEKVRHSCLIYFKHSYINICVVTLVKFIVLKNFLPLEEGKMANANIALECGLNFEVGCQDRLRMNSDADEALA